MNYAPFRPPVSKDVDHPTMAEWRQYFDWFVSEIPSRVRQLECAVRSVRGFGGWRADLRPASLKPLGKWFVRVVEDRKLTRGERAELRKALIPLSFLPDRDLTGLTLSLCADVGIYVGEVLRKRHPNLFWHQFLRAKTWVDYGLPVLVEFTEGPFNPLSQATIEAYRSLDGEPDPLALWRQYRYWSRDATFGVRK